VRDLLGLGSATPNADRSKTITDARVERKMSQAELADAIGYYPSVIEDAEGSSDGVDGLCLIAIFELEGALGLPEGALIVS
jgi:predicted transcriptional regulator